MYWFEQLNPIFQAFLATLLTWGITALGALTVCFFKEINKKILDTILGFSAGVMLAAAFWSLLAPSIELSFELRLHNVAITCCWLYFSVVYLCYTPIDF